MYYNKRYIDAEDNYQIEEVFLSGRIRRIDELQPDYVLWLGKGNSPTVILYEPIEIIPPSLEDVKRSKRQELMRNRDAVIEEGFLYKGKTYPITSDTQTMMLIQFQSSSVIPAPSYSWKDKYGIYVEIGDATAFQTFAMTAMMYGQSVYSREEMLQGLVEKATTIAELEQITWLTVPDNN